MLYDIEVRPGPNTGFFQYYVETVEAATSHDAESRVQRANPGCIVRCCRSYNDDGEESSSDGGFDGAGILMLAVIVFAIAAWKYILIFGGIALVIWLLIRFANDN